MVSGATEATGLTVIIDVFRAFSLECYLVDMGGSCIRPVGSLEEAEKWKSFAPDCLLIGERGGKKCEGFDFGNSPSQVLPGSVFGKQIIHTTSAGTQGIVNAVHAKQIITGSLVNAKAIATYILQQAPSCVSLVAMGNNGMSPAPEDELCSDYIAGILSGEPLPDMEERLSDLKYHGGEHFFNGDTQEIYPEQDFYLCTQLNRFDFILQIQRDEFGLKSVPLWPDAIHDNSCLR